MGIKGEDFERKEKTETSLLKEGVMRDGENQINAQEKRGAGMKMEE